MFPLGNTAARRPGRRIRVTLRSDDAEPITGALAALREVGVVRLGQTDR